MRSAHSVGPATACGHFPLERVFAVPAPQFPREASTAARRNSLRGRGPQTSTVLPSNSDRFPMLRSWRQRKIGPPWIKVGRAVVYNHNSTDQYLASREAKPGREAR